MKFEAEQLSPIERLYRRRLPEAEIIEARHNLVGLYSLLIKIDRRIKSDEERKNNEKMVG